MFVLRSTIRAFLENTTTLFSEEDKRATKTLTIVVGATQRNSNEAFLSCPLPSVTYEASTYEPLIRYYCQQLRNKTAIKI